MSESRQEPDRVTADSGDEVLAPPAPGTVWSPEDTPSRDAEEAGFEQAIRSATPDTPENREATESK